ncbi:MFS transporter [Catenulispora pinisilvae]|uniref:MFS transporter n=1 Tax=Catenulispora pinisilvae TaxID=2705253 RepID=UPI001892236E|nr:MFS transporter [Catenulispora pinisilvae]
MRRAAAALLALTVGCVLADSAVVTLALPEILERLHTTVGQVAWVLIAFNLVLAVVARPAAWFYKGRDPAVLCAAGIAVFAGASALCAVAGSLDVLVAARSVQAVGGAFAVIGCLQLLVDELTERRGMAWWIAAGVFGTAVGPVAGGLLTDAFSWRSIFIVQVPIAVLAVPAALAKRRRSGQGLADETQEHLTQEHLTEERDAEERDTQEHHAPKHRVRIRPNIALALLSAALTAALFLFVLLLVDGWRRSPAVAAVTVSVIPLAALLARPLTRTLRSGPMAQTTSGCLLIAGGLTGLALLPSADLAWTIAPQALVGLGLGLTLDPLTLQAMDGRTPLFRHGGWTIAARHAGVVLGLAILTPVFTADLRSAQPPAEDAITALVLNAPLAPQDKITIARGLADQLKQDSGRVPDLDPAFQQLSVPAAEKPAVAQLERDLNLQLQRAATHAFRNAFLIGAALALVALLSLIPLRRGGVR